MNDALYQLIYDILNEHSPEECKAFSIVGKEMIAARLNPSKSRRGGASTFGIATELETGLLMVHLLAGTLAVIETYTSTRRIKEEAALREELQQAFADKLIAHNVPPMIAVTASKQKLADLVRILDLDKKPK